MPVQLPIMENKEVMNQGSGDVTDIMQEEINYVIKKMKNNITYGEDGSNLTNYRPISLLHYLYKLFTSILNSRIENKLDFYQSKE